MGDIGTYVCAENCKKLQKISIFLRKLLKIEGIEHFSSISWQICGRYAQVYLKIDVHKNCNFFELFWPKVLKIEEISTFWLKIWEIMGDIHEPTLEFGLAQKLQKISIFLRKSLKYAYFERFWAKSWDICGTYPKIEVAQKLQFFSTLQYIYY